MEKLNTRSLPGATGFSLQGGRGIPPCRLGPPKSFLKFDPPVPTPNPLPNSFVFMEFTAIFHTFLRKCMEKQGEICKNSDFFVLECFHFYSRSLFKPNFWYSSPIQWVIQRLLGIFRDFEFLAHFQCRECHKIDFCRKNAIFWTFQGLQRWAKKSKSQKSPSSVLITQKMGPLHQNKGFKRELEQK